MNFKRVVSLSPSITETLYALGAGKRVVGVTDACDYPYEVNDKPHVCSWFDPDLDRLKALKPDLVIGLATAHGRLAPMFQDHGIHCEFLHPITIEDVLNDILRLGELLEVPVISQLLVETMKRRLIALDDCVAKVSQDQRLTVLRILDIENNELIVAGPQSFQYDVISRAGGINVTSSFDAAYPKVSFQQMKEWDAAMIFLCGSDERYLARLKTHQKWQTLTAVRNSRFHQFDCGLTCRTSPRIVDMAELLFQTLYSNSAKEAFQTNCLSQ